MTSEWEKWIKDFISQWINGLMQGIEEIPDPEIKKNMFKHAGAACAKAHAEVLFTKTWEETEGNLDLFFQKMNEKFGAEIYKKNSENQVTATYPKCYCPLVDLGLTKSPTLCNCSPHWIQNNFEAILDRKITVERKQSVLTGGAKCAFIINLE